ncbi:hypothetical protein PMKS-003091 [Pichia membranifaciens]|uniref:Uncharacterized protein n=1 Tax=Pichia membranifaciens TaxID=4926 RepID=A0A1Q2YJ83_9ASCO|nr:hypothetical protein PMKS-003091 [Pichia membranifaciens]
MVNELSSTETPELAPPSEQEKAKVSAAVTQAIEEQELQKTPDSISSSIESYSPVIPAVAHREAYTNNTSKSELESFDIPSKAETLVENDAIDDSFADLSSSASIKTFSSDEQDVSANGPNAGSRDDDSDIFEHFNGSTKDLASPSHKRAIEYDIKNPTFSLQIDKIRYSNDNSNNSASGGSADSNAPITPLTPMMEEDLKEDFKHDPKYRNLSRNITPLVAKNGVSELAMMSRIQDLESQSDDLDKKYFKLEREIAYVKEMLSGMNYNGYEAANSSVEARKLLYAKGKLEERLQDAKKKRYDVGVTLIKLRRSLYGDNSGDMTGYFARNVSN